MLAWLHMLSNATHTASTQLTEPSGHVERHIDGVESSPTALAMNLHMDTVGHHDLGQLLKDGWLWGHGG